MLLLIFAAIGFIIILGFLGNYIFRKTMIPDIFWLLILGIIIGPILHLVDASLFVQVTPFFTALAILTILFHGGLHTNIYLLIKESPRSALLAVMGILFSMVVTAVITNVYFHWPLYNGLLLGAILGGSSSAIVFSITERLRMREEVKTLLNLESTLTDAFCIIVAMVITQIIVVGNYSIEMTASSLMGSFSIGATVGLLAGLFWLSILSRLKGKPFEYMLTLAFLLILYSLVETIRGSGAITALTFGVVLANGKEISKILRFRKRLVIDRNVKKFHEEVSFLIRTFFFVYLGLLVSVSGLNVVIFGVILAFALLFSRIASVTLSTIRSGIQKAEKGVMYAMVPRGLAAAVLTQLPLAYGIAYAQMYTDIVVVVIVASIIIGTFGIAYTSRKVTVTGDKIRKAVVSKSKKPTVR